MSFKDTAEMFVAPCARPLTPHHYAYVPTTTCRDWSQFDRPAVLRMTAKRVRNVKSIRNFETGRVIYVR